MHNINNGIMNTFSHFIFIFIHLRMLFLVQHIEIARKQSASRHRIVKIRLVNYRNTKDGFFWLEDERC